MRTEKPSRKEERGVPIIIKNLVGTRTTVPTILAAATDTHTPLSRAAIMIDHDDGPGPRRSFSMWQYAPILSFLIIAYLAVNRPVDAYSAPKVTSFLC